MVLIRLVDRTDQGMNKPTVVLPKKGIPLARRGGRAADDFPRVVRTAFDRPADELFDSVLRSNLT
jgi:hypothetical protein